MEPRNSEPRLRRIFETFRLACRGKGRRLWSAHNLLGKARERMARAALGSEEGGGLVPRPADISKVATGDGAKMAAPPPELPGK